MNIVTIAKEPVEVRLPRQLL